MGYTHYWRRKEEYSQQEMELIVRDFRKVNDRLWEHGLVLAGGLGEGDPEIIYDMVRFNGKTNCGHEEHDLSIPWPTKNAGGVGLYADEAKKGQWYAGDKINTRVCGGDCSYETFHFPRKLEPREWQEPDKKGLLFNCCKTAYRPYDLAVFCFLIIAKHHLGESIIVHSDGTLEQCFDSMSLCQELLGYGLEFDFDKD